MKLTKDESILLLSIIGGDVSYSPTELENGTAAIKETLLAKIYQQLSEELK